VDSADDEVAWRHLGSVGEVELHGDARERVQQVGVDAGDAGCVVERREGTVRDRDGGGVLGVAGVVLSATADGYVLEDKTCCWWRERRGRGCSWLVSILELQTPNCVVLGTYQLVVVPVTDHRLEWLRVSCFLEPSWPTC
jgi:hypothetical protein